MSKSCCECTDPNVVMGPGRPESLIFHVDDRPVMLTGYDIPPNVEVCLIEMVEVCGQVFSRPASSCCVDTHCLSCNCNEVIIHTPGRYRVEASYCVELGDEDVPLPPLDTEDFLVYKREIAVNVTYDMNAKSGDSSMGNCGCGGLSYQDTKRLAEECVAAAIAQLPDDVSVREFKERVAGGWCAVLSNGDTLDIPMVGGTGITVVGGTVSADVAELANAITGDAGALQALTDAINTDVQNMFVDNGDGTATFTAPDGTTLVVSTQDIDTFAVDSTAASAGTDSYERAYAAGTPVILFPQSGRTLAFPTIETVFEEECYNLPELPASTCEIKNVALSIDQDGCGKLVTYTDGSRRIVVGNSVSVYGPTHSLQIPADPSDPNTYYNRVSLFADQTAGTLDRANKLDPNKLVSLEFEIDCPGVYEIDTRFFPKFEPLANGGAGRASLIAWEIDGVFPGVAGDTLALANSQFTNFESETTDTLTRYFTAGTHTICLYVIHDTQSSEPAQLRLGATTAPSINNAVTVSKAIV